MKKVLKLILSAPFLIVLLGICYPIKWVNDGLNIWTKMIYSKNEKE